MATCCASRKRLLDGQLRLLGASQRHPHGKEATLPRRHRSDRAHQNHEGESARAHLEIPQQKGARLVAQVH